MKTAGRIFLILVLIAGYSCTAYMPSQSYQGSGSVQLFYDELSPYGDWVHNREFGYVWIPHVGRNFFPYASHGRWIATQYGWTWFSDFDWGWAPFHYGRWDFDPNYGWFWFPGDQWAPAWVTWRQGNGFFGWSPLPPNNGMFGGGYSGGDAYRWIFVRERDFGRQNMGNYILSQRRNNEILSSTRVLEHSGMGSGRDGYHPGPDPDEVQKTTGRKIRRVEVRDSNIPGRRISNNTLELYRPRIESSSRENRPAPREITDVKDIRPMRERDMRYRPGSEPVQSQTAPGQGSRNTDRELEEIRRKREVERQYREKQVERQRQQEEIELERQRRSVGNTDQRNEPAKVQRQNRQVREQNTNQQRKTMEKERQRMRQTDQDTSRSQRVERSGNTGTRQTRR